MVAWLMLRGGMPVLPGVVGMMTVGFLLAITIDMVAPDWFEVVRSFLGTWGMAISEVRLVLVIPGLVWVSELIGQPPFFDAFIGLYISSMSWAEGLFYVGRLDGHTFITAFSVLYFIAELLMFFWLAVRINKKEGRILELKQTGNRIDY